MKEINPTSSSLPSALMCDRIALEVGVGVFIMKTKKCSTCKEIKSVDEFYNMTRSKDNKSHDCKSCDFKRTLNWFRTKRGILSRIYAHQKIKSKTRNHPPPEYNLEQLRDYIFNNPNFDVLYNDWVNSGYDKWLTPSIDRLDDYKGYSLGNIRLVTWGVNLRKVHNDMVSGINNKQSKAVLQYDIKGNFIKEYYSIMQAERETGAFHGNIISSCKNKNRTAGGFKWKYKK